MNHKTKKDRRLRGSKTHGWGSMKKHRGAGNRGGRGKAGTGKRADTKKPTIINLFGNDYFGKTGFTSKMRKIVRSINVCEVQDRVEKGILTNTINLKEIGYNKLLGKGNVSGKLNITVESASVRAIEKIKKAGGNVELLIPNKEK